MDLIDALAMVLALGLALVVFKYFEYRRIQMSQTAELTAAVNGLTTAVQAVATAFQNATANVTPDAEVAAQVTAINSATASLNALVPPPAPTPGA